MSGLMKSLAAAIAAFVLIVLVLVGCQRSFLYFPDKTAPEPGQPGVQVVKLLSEPDLELVHLYHPPRAPNGPVVVVFHGNAGHAGYRVPKFRALLDAGFGVFFAEYRGYGGNPGRPDETGLTADARAVMAYFQSEGVDPGRIVLYGESLGAGVAVKMAAEHPVAGVVLEAPYTSIADVAQAHYWYLPARWLVLDKMGRCGPHRKGERARAGRAGRGRPRDTGALRQAGVRAGLRTEGGSVPSPGRTQ